MFNLLLTILFISATPILQSTEQPVIEQLTGTVVQKPWSKSIDSYCIGGSEYFVLEYGENLTITLSHAEAETTFTNFVNQTATITGYKQTTTVSPNDRMPENGIAQTLTESVLCTIFIVQKIQ